MRPDGRRLRFYTQHVCWERGAKTFVDDLILAQGFVSSRAATSLRSIESHPSSQNFCRLPSVHESLLPLPHSTLATPAAGSSNRVAPLRRSATQVGGGCRQVWSGWRGGRGEGGGRMEVSKGAPRPRCPDPPPSGPSPPPSSEGQVRPGPRILFCSTVTCITRVPPRGGLP